MIDLFAVTFDSDNAPRSLSTTLDDEEAEPATLPRHANSGFDWQGRRCRQLDRIRPEFDAQEDERSRGGERGNPRAIGRTDARKDTRQCGPQKLILFELFLGNRRPLGAELLQNLRGRLLCARTAKRRV